MNSNEEILKNLIKEKYGSIRKFAEEADLPYTTIVSILNRGFDCTTVSKMKQIANALDVPVTTLDPSFGTIRITGESSDIIKGVEVVAKQLSRIDKSIIEKAIEEYFYGESEKLNSYFEKLNDKGKEKALDILELLTKIPEFQKDSK